MLGFLVHEAEDLLHEEALLDYVHPPNVAALEEGANEAPVQPEGSPQEMVELLVRSARAVMHFVPQGGSNSDSSWQPLPYGNNKRVGAASPWTRRRLRKARGGTRNQPTDGFHR